MRKKKEDRSKIRSWGKVKFERIHRDKKEVTAVAIELLKDRGEFSEDDTSKLIEHMMDCSVWEGGWLDEDGTAQTFVVSAFTEQVHVPGWPEMVHLSFKRLDRKPIRDWRAGQAIKNAICGPDCEGVELYPAESRRVDGANQYHLFVLQGSLQRWPFGFTERRIDYSETGGVKQRKQTV